MNFWFVANFSIVRKRSWDITSTFNVMCIVWHPHYYWTSPLIVQNLVPSICHWRPLEHHNFQMLTICNKVITSQLLTILSSLQNNMSGIKTWKVKATAAAFNTESWPFETHATSCSELFLWAFKTTIIPLQSIPYSSA
jgi:hypothetical protein